MDNKNNELFEGIIDLSNTQTNNSLNDTQNNMKYNFNMKPETLEPIVGSQSSSIGVPYSEPVQSQPLEVNPSLELIDEFPNDMVEADNVLNNVQNNTEYNFSVEPEVINPMVNLEQPTTEVISIINQVTDTTPVLPELLNEQGKTINRELLKNLNKDTNNLINPDMINPLGKQKEQNVNVVVEEPKVNYDEIKNKKNYAFMVIIFLIIGLFILFLPTILSFIGL